MTLSADLWRANADLARAALEHPFVQGLRTGSLPKSAFQAYVAQDAYFLEAFARAYALAFAHSPDRESLRDFFELLSGALDELKLHASYAARWEIDLTAVTPKPATLAYTDFLLATAAFGGVGDTCAAMTPCMRLYAYLGQQLARQGSPDGNPYAEWIHAYADPSFEALAVRLESLLDRHGRDTPAVRDVYRRAMALEVAFFQANAEVS